MELRDIRQGEDIRHDWKKVNELADYVRRLDAECLRLKSGLENLRAKVPFIDAIGGSGGEVCPFRLDSVEGDYLVCYKYVDEISWEDTVTWVAKPPELRRTPYDGQTFAVDVETATGTTTQLAWAYGTCLFLSNTYRRVEAGGWLEDQVIVPTYQPYSTIWAFRPRVGTFVEDCDWQDANVAGRAWAQI